MTVQLRAKMTWPLVKARIFSRVGSLEMNPAKRPPATWNVPSLSRPRAPISSAIDTTARPASEQGAAQR